MEEMMKLVLEKLNSFDQKLDAMQKETNERFDAVDAKLNSLQTSIDSIEQSQQEDIVAVLNLMNLKLEANEDKIEVLNSRLLHTEAKIRKVTN